MLSSQDRQFENEYEDINEGQEQDQEDFQDQENEQDEENEQGEPDQPDFLNKNLASTQNKTEKKQEINVQISRTLSTQPTQSQASSQRAIDRLRNKNQIREGLANDADLEQERKGMWKMFGIDSAAGKELYKLYKCHNQPQINYPKPKMKKPEDEQEKIKKSCPQKTQIDYPSLYKEQPKLHKIDFVPKRKREEDIRKEIELFYQGRKFYRPKIRGLDRKKLIEELQQKFKYQRGALPKGAELPTVNNIDNDIDMNAKDVFASNEETKSNAIKRTHKKYLHFVGLKNDQSDAATTQSFEPDIELNMLFEQIISEIEERQQFLQDIDGLDEPKLKQKIKDEIVERVSELQKVQELRQKL